MESSWPWGLQLLHASNDLADDVHTGSLDGLIIMLQFFHALGNRIWDMHVAELRHSSENLVAVDGHKARDDGNGFEDARLVIPKHILKLLVCFNIICELCHDEVCSGDGLFNEVWQIADWILDILERVGGMTLGVRRNTNAEVVTMLLANVPHQVDCESEVLVAIVLAMHVVFLATGRVSSQSQDIANTQNLGLLQCHVHQRSAHVRACQMQHRRQLQLALADFRQLEGTGRRASACTPSDRHEEWT